jgi:hypothetical protein
VGVASMTQTAKAIKTFASGFGLPAYSTDTVPDDVSLPYITFPLTEPEWNQKATWYLQGWYRTHSNTELFAKADEILREIGSGLIIGMEGGYLVIYPETPLVQLMVDGDTRSFYINLSINAYHSPGL